MELAELQHSCMSLMQLSELNTTTGALVRAVWQGGMHSFAKTR